MKVSSSAMLALWCGPSPAADQLSVAPESCALEIQSVVADGKRAPLGHDGNVTLGPFPQNISFGFGPAANSTQTPTRLRYKLEGYDNTWRETNGAMTLTVRFYDSAGDQISQKVFEVTGDSPGWKGGLKDSPLTHRRENIIAPPKVEGFWIVISSAGPPAAVGIYVVDDLIVSRLSPAGVPEILMRSPFDSQQGDDQHEHVLQFHFFTSGVRVTPGSNGNSWVILSSTIHFSAL